jgi:uncharacterized protein YdhG (YjbR/CyaY superfamily)
MSAQSIDEYIAACPPDVQEVCRRLRQAVHAAVPDVEEAINYQMPTFRRDGRALIHLGAWKRHIGLYPVPDLPEPLQTEIAPYRTTGSTVNLPLKEPIPYDLVQRVVEHLAQR